MRSFRFAIAGLGTMLRDQHNAWLHAVASGLVIAAGFYCGLSNLEWCAIVLAVVSVWPAEALKTAFEYLADVASPDSHPLVKKAKDVAAGAVLIAAVGSVLVGLLVFVPYF